MATPTQLPDGLDALRAEMELREIMRLIERTARWVDPATFRLLPMWYPEHARRTYFYKNNWSEPQLNKNRQTGHTEHKREGNVHANKSLTYALGLRSDDRPNWSCCHIWGVDDPSYQEANAVVQDRRFFSCVANMVLLPTPLKAFTDTMPEVKAMLRICARNLYDWHCDHESLAETIAAIETWGDWDAYPKSWPRVQVPATPLGIVPLNDGIRKCAKRRLVQIRRDLADPGPHYPIEEVKAALAYWGIPLD
ncbi:hypothetical protein [Caulobacter sp. UC70_42]|uniref:hypothetical protein n=1 Tax=Caulobacter sp. UC70_42 TaxID=3374551 RepID=UPI003757543C